MCFRIQTVNVGVFLLLIWNLLIDQADMDKPAKCRVKHCKNRNANDHTWDSKDSTANKDGDNDQKTGKSCGITKNLRSKKISVKLLQEQDKNNKVNTLDRINQQNQQCTRHSTNIWTKERNYVRHAHNNTDKQCIWQIQNRCTYIAQNSNNK